MHGPLRVAQLERIYGVDLTADHKRLIRQYLGLLNRWKKHISLTSVDRTEEFLRFHFFEAFWAVEHFLKEDATVADVGSGAGFPGMAMKLYRSSLQVTLIEKNYKKAVFLQEVSRQLDLQVEVFQDSAEKYDQWPSIDVAALRALKLSDQLLQILQDHRVDLLYFHGNRADALAGGFSLLKQEKVPESRGRFVSLFAC